MRHHHFLLQIFNQEILHQYLRVNQSKIILDFIIDHLDLIIMEDTDLVDMVINIGDLMDMEDIVHIVHMVHTPIIIIMECLVDTVVMPKIENVGKLRSTVNQLLSTFALIRFFKWLYRKIVHSTGYQNQDSINEELWDKSLAKVGSVNVHNSSYWSGFLIFSVFFVVPYIIHKISNNIKNMQIKGKDPKEWQVIEEPAYIATVLYDFVATHNDELSIKAGQKVYLAPKSLQPKNLPGWCKATDNVNVGLIPYNYIKVIGQLKKVKRDNETNPVNEEISSTNESSNHSNRKDSQPIRNDKTVENEA